MASTQKGQPEPVLITDAPENPEVELRRREIRYVAMMITRALCVVGSAVVVVQKPPLWPLLVVLLVAGGVVLPWLAVIIANDRPPRRRSPAPLPATPGTPTALPERKVIDHD